MKELDFEILDKDNYPTDIFIEYIETFSDKKDIDFKTLLKYIETAWQYKDMFVISRKYKGKRKLKMVTGGWSGNEMIINAILNNIYLTHFYMKYVKWETGGKYYFEINERQYEK